MSTAISFICFKKYKLPLCHFISLSLPFSHPRLQPLFLSPVLSLLCHLVFVVLLLLAILVILFLLVIVLFLFLIIVLSAGLIFEQSVPVSSLPCVLHRLLPIIFFHLPVVHLRLTHSYSDADFDWEFSVSVHKQVPGLPQSIPEAGDEPVKMGCWASLLLGQVAETAPPTCSGFCWGSTAFPSPTLG